MLQSTNIFRIFLYIYVFAIFFVLPSLASAANIEVNTASDTSTSGDSSCSLREAITNANSDSDSSGGDCASGLGADYVTFAANYTITLTSSLPDITTDITIDGQGTANTILQASTCDPINLPGSCTPSGWRVFTFASGSSTLKDMAIRYGNCVSGTCSDSGSSSNVKWYGGNIYAGAGSTSLILDAVHVLSGNSGDYGGGVSVWGGNLTIQNNSLIGGLGTGNLSGGDGGGVYFNNGVDLTIDNSQVSYNQTADYGGGVYFEDGNTVTIRNGSLIDQNNTGGSDAGGLYASGLTCQLTIDSSTISNNWVEIGAWGSGLYTDCETTINDSTISGNTAEDSTGGGIYIGTSTNVTITNSTIANNQTTHVSGTNQDGGGIYNRGTLTVVNSTFYNNDSYNYGGGIYNRSGATATLINTTFSGHTADYGDSIYNAGTLHISNNIIANGVFTNNNCINDGGSIATDINNLIEDNGTSGFECGTPASTADPMLGPLASNGGPTQTMALLPGSPAIDAGDDTVCADPGTVNNFDQRGISRSQENGCDIGAYEMKLFFWPMFLPAITGTSYERDQKRVEMEQL